MEKASYFATKGVIYKPSGLLGSQKNASKQILGPFLIRIGKNWRIMVKKIVLKNGKN